MNSTAKITNKRYDPSLASPAHKKRRTTKGDDDTSSSTTTSFNPTTITESKRIAYSHQKNKTAKITVEGTTVYIPAAPRCRRISNTDENDIADDLITPLVNNVSKIDINDIPDLPFDMPPFGCSSSENNEEEVAATNTNRKMLDQRDKRRFVSFN